MNYREHDISWESIITTKEKLNKKGSLIPGMREYRIDPSLIKYLFNSSPIQIKSLHNSKLTLITTVKNSSYQSSKISSKIESYEICLKKILNMRKNNNSDNIELSAKAFDRILDYLLKEIEIVGGDVKKEYVTGVLEDDLSIDRIALEDKEFLYKFFEVKDTNDLYYDSDTSKEMAKFSYDFFEEFHLLFTKSKSYVVGDWDYGMVVRDCDEQFLVKEQRDKYLGFLQGVLDEYVAWDPGYADPKTMVICFEAVGFLARSNLWQGDELLLVEILIFVMKTTKRFSLFCTHASDDSISYDKGLDLLAKIRNFVIHTTGIFKLLKKKMAKNKKYQKYDQKILGELFTTVSIFLLNILYTGYQTSKILVATTIDQIQHPDRYKARRKRKTQVKRQQRFKRKIKGKMEEEVNPKSHLTEQMKNASELDESVENLVDAFSGLISVLENLDTDNLIKSKEEIISIADNSISSTQSLLERIIINPGLYLNVETLILPLKILAKNLKDNNGGSMNGFFSSALVIIFQKLSIAGHNNEDTQGFKTFQSIFSSLLIEYGEGLDRLNIPTINIASGLIKSTFTFENLEEIIRKNKSIIVQDHEIDIGTMVKIVSNDDYSRSKSGKYKNFRNLSKESSNFVERVMEFGNRNHKEVIFSLIAFDKLISKSFSREVRGDKKTQEIKTEMTEFTLEMIEECKGYGICFSRVLKNVDFLFLGKLEFQTSCGYNDLDFDQIDRIAKRWKSSLAFLSETILKISIKESDFESCLIYSDLLNCYKTPSDPVDTMQYTREVYWSHYIYFGGFDNYPIIGARSENTSPIEDLEDQRTPNIINLEREVEYLKGIDTQFIDYFIGNDPNFWYEDLEADLTSRILQAEDNFIKILLYEKLMISRLTEIFFEVIKTRKERQDVILIKYSKLKNTFSHIVLLCSSYSRIPELVKNLARLISTLKKFIDSQKIDQNFLALKNSFSSKKYSVFFSGLILKILEINRDSLTSQLDHSLIPEIEWYLVEESKFAKENYKSIKAKVKRKYTDYWRTMNQLLDEDKLSQTQGKSKKAQKELIAKVIDEVNAIITGPRSLSLLEKYTYRGNIDCMEIIEFILTQITNNFKKSPMEGKHLLDHSIWPENYISQLNRTNDRSSLKGPVLRSRSAKSRQSRSVKISSETHPEPSVQVYNQRKFILTNQLILFYIKNQVQDQYNIGRSLLHKFLISDVRVDICDVETAIDILGQSFQESSKRDPVILFYYAYLLICKIGFSPRNFEASLDVLFGLVGDIEASYPMWSKVSEKEFLMS